MSQIATLPNTILRTPALAVPKARGAGWPTEQTYIDWLLEFYGNSIVGLWRQDDVGSVAFDAGPRQLHGVHVGATPRQADIPWSADRPVAMEYDGATRYTNVYSAALAAAFNGAEGTLMAWARVANAGVWTDGAFRRINNIFVDASNRVSFRKDLTNNQLLADYTAGSVVKTVTISFSNVEWNLFTITWSKSTDKMIVFINKMQQGATQTGLGTWVGSIDPAACCIGSNTNAPVQVWAGLIAPTALLNRAANGYEIAQTYAKGIQAMGGA